MANIEEIKKNSNYLRGTIKEELESDSSHFNPENFQILKFHGTYQQDDRDLRKERKKAKMERAYIMMVRTRIPGGRLTSQQYLKLDRIASEVGNETLRITSRQGFQFHSVLKGNLHSCIRQINETGLTTMGACGDVNRNIVTSASPLHTPEHEAIGPLIENLINLLSLKTMAYAEIWLNGEKVNLPEEDREPLYTNVYMPRKFKIGIAVPPRNDVDIYSNDLGLVPHAENGEVVGYTILAGGGFGMSAGKDKTYPRLSQPVFFIDKDHIIEAVRAVVTVQRDYGNRQDRKRARMKYLIDERGIDWFKNEVISRIGDNAQISEPKPLHWTTVEDMLGWHQQGNGKLLRGLWIPEGRIKDTEHERYRSAIRAIAEDFNFPIRTTPNCNLLFHNIDPSQQEAVDAILYNHNIPPIQSLTRARQIAMACVSLPTCGLGVAESERVFQDQVMDEVDKILYELGLENEPLLIRMTGCPNGCARPYNADIAFVGKSPGRYMLFIGGCNAGLRLGALEQKMIKIEDIPTIVRSLLEAYGENRLEGESFTDYWGRTKNHPKEAHPLQFHREPSERETLEPVET